MQSSYLRLTSKGNRAVISVGILFIAFVLLSSCAHYPVNSRVENINGDFQGKAFSLDSPERSDELFLVLAFSGGGTRAAALTYGVLEALEKVKISGTQNSVAMSGANKPHALLDEVDTITSVSGVSFTAAYYGLHQKRIFKDFKERFLTRNVERDLFFRILSPFNWFRLPSGTFGNSDLAAEYYDQILFEGATLKDLFDQSGPFIQIQATDMVDGLHFEFTPPLFNLICSDPDTFPISRAVAASAAFPGPFGPIVLKNYARKCGYKEPAWVAKLLEERDITSNAFHAAMRVRTFRDPEKKPFIYLLDGGVADNLGIRGPLEIVAARAGMRGSFEEFGLHRTRHAAFIVVNAQTSTRTGSSLLGKIPGIGDIIGATSSIMVNSINNDTMELLRRNVREWSMEVKRRRSKDFPIDFYIIEVSFMALPDDEERSYFTTIPTKLSLPEETVDRLREVAGRLLYDSKDFQKLIQNLGGEIPQ
jgi:NTE family protein